MRSVVDGYSIGDPIGIGGFSTVYRARQDQFDRDVALKILNIRLDDPRAVKRFNNECLALGRLDFHPHIADIYAAGIGEDSQPYIAMRWYRNGSAADLLAAKGTLPIEQVVSLGLQVADALAAAHDLGIIHRDVKPQNILVSDRGTFALSDFGVSVLEHESANTVTQAFTYDHAAPEILETEEFGPASDQYALASTLYTLVVGSVPFPVSAPAQQIRAIATSNPDLTDPRLATIAPVLARAMAKNPDERFESMSEFANALTAAHAGTTQGVPSSRPTHADTVIKSGRARLRTAQAQPPAGSPDSVWGLNLNPRFTTPFAAGLVVVATSVIYAVWRWLILATQDEGAPANAEWISFQSALAILAAITAAALMNVRGPCRALGYGAALYVLVARFKVSTGALLTAYHENRMVAVSLWVLLLVVIAGALAIVSLSAWRHRAVRPRGSSSLIALWIMLGTAAAAAVYGFWTWSGTIKNVSDFAILCGVIALSTAVTVFTIVIAYRFDGQLGLLGYAGIFTILHALFVLGAAQNLPSISHRLWYEIPLLIALISATAFALYAGYPAIRRRSDSVDDVIDIRSRGAVEIEVNRKPR